MAKKMVPNRPLNGNTVGGSTSFKAGPGHIVFPDRRRRMEFTSGCQKVSSPCERSSTLFTAPNRAQGLLYASPHHSQLLSLSLAVRICARVFPQSEWLRRDAPPPPFTPCMRCQPSRNIGLHLPPIPQPIPLGYPSHLLEKGKKYPSIVTF